MLCRSTDIATIADIDKNTAKIRFPPATLPRLVDGDPLQDLPVRNNVGFLQLIHFFQNVYKKPLGRDLWVENWSVS